MRLSTRLLLLVLTLAVFALVGTNLVLKAEYEKINFADPFWNYERVPLAQFQHLNLAVTGVAPVEIRQSTVVEPVLYVGNDWKDSIQTQRNQDTLQLRLLAGTWDNFRPQDFEADYLDRKPSLVLFVPDLRTLSLQHQTWVRIRGTRFDSLRIRATADANVSLINSRTNLLSLTLRDSASVSIQPRCQVGTLSVDAAGKSTLQLRAESVGRFQPVIHDERVELRLSGKALTSFVKP